MTYSQGEQLDLVSEELDKSVNHLNKANENLDEASKYSKEQSRACLCLGLALLVVACVILVLMLFLCFYAGIIVRNADLVWLEEPYSTGGQRKLFIIMLRLLLITLFLTTSLN